MNSFEIQGHRGARAIRPENTIPSFEAALDASVQSIETDIQFTADGDAILHHDGAPNPRTCSNLASLPADRALRFIRMPTVAATALIVDRNPDPVRFPQQSAARTALSERFAGEPYSIPLLHELFDFVSQYAGAAGEHCGKTPSQRMNAGRVIFDLEIKSEPFDGPVADEHLKRLAMLVSATGMAARCRVRSFDHWITRRFHTLLPDVPLGVLIARTVVIDPVRLARDGQATFYCPDYQSLDLEQVERLHGDGIRVLPWTVNDPVAWRRLLAWNVDGITTDDPAALAQFVGVFRGEVNE